MLSNLSHTYTVGIKKIIITFQAIRYYNVFNKALKVVVIHTNFKHKFYPLIIWGRIIMFQV